MAIAFNERMQSPAAPNASDFLELYAFERPPTARPVDEFIAELKDLVRTHPIDGQLAEALKYGGASREGLQRWIKDYYQFIRLDAQGTAATIARCRRRGLFLALSQLVNRKTGFHQVTTPPLQLFQRFAAAFGVTPAELEGHYACPETMQATYTRLQFQFSSFEEGFVVSALAAEGALLDVVRDERPWLCQRGIAEYMKRAFQLDDETVAYWRAYEDFRSFVCEPVWEAVRELAADAAQQELLRKTLHHWLLIYQNMRRAWSEMVTGRYPLPDFTWPPAGSTFKTGDDQSYAELEDELSEFCLALPRPKETAFGLLLSGRASIEATKELVKDFIHLDATRNIAGQLSQMSGGKAYRAIAQAFATESGGFLTRNHMEIWADFCEQALGITRADLFRWIPPTETIAGQYVTKWFLVHGSPEEAIAAFHLGPPTAVKEKMGKRALGLGQGGVAGEGLIESSAKNTLSLAFERLGIDADLAEYFFRLHREIEPFEQDEGWEYVPEVLATGVQRRIFKRAYITKILSERRKDEGLLKRMKQLSGLA
jgi:pyrroloquinoline quinone (PQQ) biosynthesis protein C